MVSSISDRVVTTVPNRYRLSSVAAVVLIKSSQVLDSALRFLSRFIIADPLYIELSICFPSLVLLRGS